MRGSEIETIGKREEKRTITIKSTILEKIRRRKYLRWYEVDFKLSFNGHFSILKSWAQCFIATANIRTSINFPKSKKKIYFPFYNNIKRVSIVF